MNALRDEFFLDPNVVFLNHGSFGACPRPVFNEYQRWQRELERQPVDFFGRRFPHLMKDARIHLATYLGVDASHITYVHNATAGVNVVARSLPLQAGDEVLSTDHEYGACVFAWKYVCDKASATFIEQPIPLPVTTVDDFVERVWAGVTERTKMIYLSHITSPTGLVFPIKPLIDRAREKGILTFIDGAHVPSQLPINLEELGADMYTGNCHKWLCAPKGAAFLYARPEHHEWLYPLVISWGMMEKEQNLVNRHQYQATFDISPYLSVHAAIEFQKEYHWDGVRAQCHQMARDMRLRFAELTGTQPIMPDSNASPDGFAWFGQMIASLLPEKFQNVEAATKLKDQLYEEFKIEIPIFPWKDQFLIRASFQGYNTPEDAEKLVSALQKLF